MASEMIRKATENALYLESVRQEYTERYPDKWIAVSDKQVFGPEDSAGRLRALLLEQNVDISITKFAFLTKNRFRPMILA